MPKIYSHWIPAFRDLRAQEAARPLSTRPPSDKHPLVQLDKQLRVMALRSDDTDEGGSNGENYQA